MTSSLVPWPTRVPCVRCRDLALERISRTEDVYFCADCKGLFYGPGALEGALGVRLARRPPMHAVTLDHVGIACPACATGHLFEQVVDDTDVVLHDCAHCGRVWVDGGLIERLRTQRARAITLVGPGPETRVRLDALFAEDEVLAASRIPFESRVLQLGVWPLVIVLAWLFAATELGDVLLCAFGLLFHELGHAVASWLSGRPALPLPCGITFTAAEPTLLANAVVTMLAGALIALGVRERRGLPIALGVSSLVAELVLSSLGRSRAEYVFLGSGLAGEIVLSTFALVAFHFPMPDRMRWDFMRLPVLGFAAGAWAHAARLWHRVATDPRAMPRGSIMGSGGDRQGDVERLLDDHGATLIGLADFYVALVSLSALVLVATYVLVAIRLGVIPPVRRPRSAP